MASPSLALTGRQRSSNQNARHGFAESNPKVRIELKKQEIKLEKELSLLDKLARTETNNISSHQQAIKMNWRRLEQKRLHENSRNFETNGKQSRNIGHRHGLLFSKTPMSVDATSSIYDGSRWNKFPRGSIDSSTKGLKEEDNLHSTGSLTGLQNDGNGFTVSDSPYISSPLKVRRWKDSSKFVQSSLSIKKEATSILNTKARLKTPTINEYTSDPNNESLTNLEAKVKTLTLPVGSKSTKDSSRLLTATQETKPILKLPPLQLPYTQSEVLVARSDTIDKDTLLKAASMLKESKSQGPNAFHQFYTSSASSSTDMSSKILLSPADHQEKQLLVERDTTHRENDLKPNNVEKEVRTELLKYFQVYCFFFLPDWINT